MKRFYLPNKAAAGHMHYKNHLNVSQVCCLHPAQLISLTIKNEIVKNNTVNSL